MILSDEEEEMEKVIQQMAKRDLFAESDIDSEEIKLKNLEEIRHFLSKGFDKEAIASLCVYLHTNSNFLQDLKTLIMAYNGQVKFGTAKNYAKQELEYEKEEFEA